MFEVRVKEINEKRLYLEAESQQDAEDRAMEMYATGDFVMDRLFDSYVEVDARETWSLSKRYLQELGWSTNFAEYVLDMFGAMDIRNSAFRSRILDIADYNNDLILFYNEKAFDRDCAEFCGFEFKYLIPGIFDEVSGCYKTKDNKYIAKINL